MTISTISLPGQGGDYSSLEAWQDDAPADLVAAQDTWIGEILNSTDNFVFGDITALTISGSTTNSSYYKELRAGTGASFSDGIGSNPLRFDESYGCSISCDRSFGAVILVNENYFKLKNIQVRSNGSNGRAIDVLSSNVTIDSCILENTENSGSYVGQINHGCVISNCLIIQKAPSPYSIIYVWGTGQLLNNTMVVPSDYTSATYGIDGGSSGQIITNNAIFGVTNLTSISAGTFSNCYTDGSFSKLGVTATTYDTTTGSGFENTLASNLNYKIKDTSILKDNGVTISLAYDILQNPRPQGGSFDVGCYEVISSVPTVTNISPIYYNILLRTR